MAPDASGHHATVAEIYAGSNGDATKALYDRLTLRGPAGVVAVNLFRASKCSVRAKLYRPGRGHRTAAYDRKQWSIDNLVAALQGQASALGLVWGWAVDPDQAYHRHVLYIDLPTGQVSFHSEKRGDGPDYPAKWDGMRGASPGRIIRWVADVLGGSAGSSAS